VGLFVYLNGNKTSGDLTVSALEWTRNIQIEENIQYSESGWDVPDTAEVTSQRQELHHYDSVFSHYKDVEVQRSRRVLDHYETYYTYDKPVYGMFIAVRIDTNTAETFRHGVWYAKGDEKQRLNIVPFTLAQFQRYFEMMFSTGEAKPQKLVELIDCCVRKRDMITALHLRVGRLFCCGFWQVFMLQLVKLFLNLFTGGDVGAQEQHRA
jgi:hypothetical protein